MTLTQQVLQRELRYDPNTGLFTRPNGEVAGTLTRYGYHQISVLGRKYRAARLAFLYVTGKWPVGIVDHDNRVRHDDRWSNLIDASFARNRHNSPRRSTKTTALPRGVFTTRSGRYRASLMRGPKNEHLGTFDTVDEAHAARLAAELKYQGDFR